MADFDNEVVQQVIATIRKDILTNTDFLNKVLAGIQLQEKNIPHTLILKLMSDLSSKQPPRPVSNAPRDKKGVVARPVAIAQDSVETKIVSDLLEGNNVYLMGKAGTGKTYLAKAIARLLMDADPYIINCSQWTSPINIIGGQTIKGYQEGELIKAWANGGVLILDELPKLDPNTAGLLNDALAEAAAKPKYDDEGKVIPDTVPYIVNGRGERIYKGQDQTDESKKFRFCVIGTGNTDMMNVGNRYSGNQRQDYSLVDRFAGSFYTIEENPVKEKELTYEYVFNVCSAIRNFLNSRPDAIQSISLRTMLNFNRTYEQEMLYKIESPYADAIYDNVGNRVSPKSIEDSIQNFLNMMDKGMRNDLENFPEFIAAIKTDFDENFFMKEFMLKYHLNPKTGDALTEEEIKKLIEQPLKK